MREKPRKLFEALSSIPDDKIWEILKKYTCTSVGIDSLTGAGSPDDRRMGCEGMSCDECILGADTTNSTHEERAEETRQFKADFIGARKLRRKRKVENGNEDE